MRIRFFLLQLVAALLLLAACGGDPLPAPPQEAQEVPEQTQQQIVAEPQPAAQQQETQPQAQQPAAQPAPAEQEQAEPEQQAQTPPAEDESTDEDQSDAPPPLTVREAVNFAVAYIDDIKLVQIVETMPGGAPAAYLLVPRGAEEPEGGWALWAADHTATTPTVVEIPIRSIFTSSTTQLPALDILGVVDRLTGVAQQAFVSTASVRALIDADRIVEFAPTYAVEAEAVVAAQPDLLMTSGFWDDAYDIIQSAGTAIVHNADWVESSPLGRAEWVKFISLFFDREAEAEAWFEQVRADYEAVKALAADVERRPTVHTGQVWGGIWYASGGRSYVAQLLADAGADYVWADDDSTGSMELDIETQLAQANAAEFWLHAASWWANADAALAEDSRYGEFASFQNGNVWNPTLATNAQGGNDFFESGSVRPDLVLRDLIAILHPELLPDHAFVYYQQLATE